MLPDELITAKLEERVARLERELDQAHFDAVEIWDAVAYWRRRAYRAEERLASLNLLEDGVPV